MTKEDEQFIKDNIYNFECVKAGFMKNLPLHILIGYEQIYRTYLDGGFILTSWCSSCVADMMKRLSNYWETYEASKLIDYQEGKLIEQTIPKKKGRPFKNTK